MRLAGSCVHATGRTGGLVLVAVLALMLLNGCSSDTHTLSVSGNESDVVARYASGSCARELFAPRSRAKPLGIPLPAGARSSFAVFRRATLPGDAPPKGALATELYNNYELASYYPAYVRQLPGPTGRRDFVVPAFAQVNEPQEACLPLHVNRAVLRAQQRRRAVDLLYCFIEVPERKGLSLGCEPFAAIGQSENVFSASDFLREPLVELVPDGVAAVRVTYRGRTPIVVAVSENAFAFTPPSCPPRLAAVLRRLQERVVTGNPSRYNRALRQTDPTKIEWLNRAGGVTRVIEPPTRKSIEATSVGAIRAPIGG